MISAQSLLLLVLGLAVAGTWNTVQADRVFNSKIKNSTHYRPSNKTHHYEVEKPATVESDLYMKFACQGKQNGLRLPVDGSCTQYLECQRGQAKLMTCKNEKHFSALGLACVDAHLSNCMVKRNECFNKTNGLYPDFKNCSNYIVCLDGKGHHGSCGKTLEFSAKNLICDIPRRSGCSKQSNNTIIERKIEPLPKVSKIPMFLTSHFICRNKTTGSTVGISGTCNKFYLCINGKGHLKSCGHMQFNTEAHYCDTRTRIYCPEFQDNEIIFESDDKPTSSEVPQEWLRPEINEYPDNINELQPPHREPGKPFPQEQVPDHTPLHPPVVGVPQYPPVPYIPGHEIEKPPIAVDPVPPTIYVPDTEVDPKEYAGLCDGKSVGALIALPRHCTQYVHCKWDWYESRVAEIKKCPMNKHFNSKTKICEEPEKAGCRIHLN